MAVTLDATPKSLTANTYATRAEANTYHDKHVDAGADWSGASDANKDIALAMATRVLDAKFEWEGQATDENQIIQWPRAGLLNFIRRAGLDADTYPTQLIDATSELARLLLAADTTADMAQSVQGLTGLKVGSIQLNFKEYMGDSKPIPDSVRDLLPYWWGTLRGAGITRPILRA